MAWGVTWEKNLKVAIEAHFLSMFGKDLIVDMNQLVAYLKERGIADEHVAVGHFKRVMLYYKEKYKFIPRFSHLLSTKIPVVETHDWEAALYSKYPAFAPYTFVDQKKSLSRGAVDKALFDARRCEYFYKFARSVTAHPDPIYCYRAMLVLERLAYSLAKRKGKGGMSPAVAVDAHNRLRKIRVPERDTDKVWRIQHFSKVLVKKQIITVFGYGFTFWELPKLIVDHAFAENILNCRLTKQHVQSIMTVLSDYGFRYREYLPFLIKVRADYVLRHSSDIDAWESVKPDFIPEYPYR